MLICCLKNYLEWSWEESQFPNSFIFVLRKKNSIFFSRSPWHLQILHIATPHSHWCASTNDTDSSSTTTTPMWSDDRATAAPPWGAPPRRDQLYHNHETTAPLRCDLPLPGATTTRSALAARHHHATPAPLPPHHDSTTTTRSSLILFFYACTKIFLFISYYSIKKLDQLMLSNIG